MSTTTNYFYYYYYSLLNIIRIASVSILTQLYCWDEALLQQVANRHLNNAYYYYFVACRLLAWSIVSSKGRIFRFTSKSLL